MPRKIWGPLLLCSLLSVTSNAAPSVPEFRSSAIKAEHKITAVKAFSDRARVSRTAKVRVKPGQNWLHFAALPQNADKNTFRTAVHGKAKIAQVVLQSQFERKPLPPEAAPIVANLRRWYGDLLELRYTASLFREQLQFIRGLDFNAPFSKNNGDDYQSFTVPMQTVDRALSSIRNSADKTLDRLQEVRQREAELRERIDHAHRKIQNFTNLKEQQWFTHAYVQVESDRNQTLDVDLSYMVPNAKWYPVYDLRAELDRNRGKARINLVTSGLVEQHTGETWQGVELSLSTLDPTPLYLPAFSRWKFTENREEELSEPASALFSMAGGAAQKMESVPAAKESKKRQVRARARGNIAPSAPAADRMADKDYANEVAAAPAEQMAALEKGGMRALPAARRRHKQKPATNDLLALQPLEHKFPQLAQVEQALRSSGQSQQTQLFAVSGPLRAPRQNRYSDPRLPAVQAKGRNLSFVSPFPLTLDSDEEPRKIPLQSQELTGSLSYFAVPKQDNRVYLRAKTQNTLDHPVLAGSAQVFMNGDLITKTKLRTINEGGYFQVDLGVDPNVKTKRIVTRKSKDKGMVFSKHVTDVHVKIEVANHHDFPVSMELKDHYPISPTDEIEVELVEVAPKPAQEHHGIFTWNLPVSPKGKRELEFTYRVTHPENYLVSELN